MSLSSLEICAGGGGQALGLEKAGFEPQALVEIDGSSCETLRSNRPRWNVLQQDLHDFDGCGWDEVDVLAGGVPCPPFSKAGRQLGADDQRDLFPTALRLVDHIRPKAVMFENVRGFLDALFEDYREELKSKLRKMGYTTDWRLLNASDFGVSQLRPRVVIIAVAREFDDCFDWPTAYVKKPRTVGKLLEPLMAENGWNGSKDWAKLANDIAPTLVGGSKKHGGPDLGPTRAKKAWAALGVDGMGIANDPPSTDFVGMPRLTVPMAARVQGFPSNWRFHGKKTPAYRQVGNAFPPPVAEAVGSCLAKCLMNRTVVSMAD